MIKTILTPKYFIEVKAYVFLNADAVTRSYHRDTAFIFSEEFMKQRKIFLIILTILLPIAAAIICLCIGRMGITVSDIFASLFGKEIGALKFSVIWNQRFPRILTAAIAGAGLSVAGCIFQGMFANPLASPDTLGVASGASFGAALSILIGFSMIGTQFFAFIFGFSAIALTRLCSGGKNGSRITMILAGIMFGSLFSSLVSLVKFLADTESQLPAITYWLMGSFGSSGYKSLAFGAPLTVLPIIILMLMRSKLDLLPLSDDEAASLGANVRLLRGVSSVCAAAITASCVSMCGQVGWVGLLVPHICRMLFGNHHRYLIPASVCIGSAFMIVVDTVARTLTATEIPVSVLTAIIGAPFFILILRKTGGRNL